MATYYISTTGNDSTGDGSTGNRWATLTKAVTSCANGDTIVIGDGVYNEAAAVIPTKKNLTILPETDYGCTLRAASGTTRVFHCPRVSVGGSAYVFGKITIDANNAQSYCVTCDSVDVVDSITFNGTKLLNPTTSFASLSKLSNLTMDSGWVASATGSANFGLAPSSVGVYSITDGTMIVAAAAGSSLQAINYIPSVTGCEMVLERNTITIASGASTAVTGFYGRGGTSYRVTGNTVNISGTNSGTGVNVAAHATIAATSCVIADNIGTVDTVAPVGYGVAVGDDVDAGPTNPNNIAGIVIAGNNFTNVNHGMFVGWETGAKVFGNRVNSAVIGIIGKHTIGCEFYKNIVSGGDLTGGGLRSKAGNADIFRDNTCLLELGNSSIGAYATDSATGCEFTANIIKADDADIANLVKVDVGSDATFSDNCYWAGATAPASAWTYQGVSYATMEDWQAVVTDSRSIYADPKLKGFSVPKSSVCVNTNRIQTAGATVAHRSGFSSGFGFGI